MSKILGTDSLILIEFVFVLRHAIVKIIIELAWNDLSEIQIILNFRIINISIINFKCYNRYYLLLK